MSGEREHSENPIPFRDVVSKFVDSKEMGQRGINAIMRYKGSLNSFIKFGATRGAVTITDYLNLVSEFTLSRKPSTVQADLKAITSALFWSEKEGLITAEDKEKLVQLRKVRDTRKPKKETARSSIHLSKEEIGKLLNATGRNKLRDRALILTAIALRPSTDDLLGLKTSNITTNEEGKVIVKIGSTKRQLPAEMASTLTSYKSTVKSEYLFARDPKEENSPPMTRQGLGDILKRNAKRAGIKKVNMSILTNTGNYLLSGASDLSSPHS